MITDKAIANATDATWNGYARSRFVERVGEEVNSERVQEIYLTVAKNKRDVNKLATFVKELARGQFVGTVVYHTLRIHFGH